MKMIAYYKNTLKTVWKLVEEAGELLVARRLEGRPLYCMKSGPTDLLTQSDKDVERKINAGISALYPKHRFISEERDAVDNEFNKITDEPTWILDPLDGTMNYIHGFPFYSISLALVLEKIPVIGIIYNPRLGQKISAASGSGAFYNGRALNVCCVSRLSQSLLSSEYKVTKSEEEASVTQFNYKDLGEKVHGFRSVGSTSLDLAMVAAGGADAFWDMNIRHWNVAAGVMIIKEAGGVVMDPSGKPYEIFSRRILAASTNDLACAIVKKLKLYSSQLPCPE